MTADAPFHPERELATEAKVRARFWVESAVAAASGLLALLTLFSRDWIEALTGVDPDRHSGSLEWAIVAGLFSLCVAVTVVARSERWRARPASALGG